MIITIFGSGCTKCKQTEELVRRVVLEVGVEAEIVKVSKIKAIIDAGIMLTPAVAVDGVVKLSGRVPKTEEVERWLTPP